MNIKDLNDLLINNSSEILEINNNFLLLKKENNFKILHFQDINILNIYMKINPLDIDKIDEKYFSTNHTFHEITNPYIDKKNTYQLFDLLSNSKPNKVALRKNSMNNEFVAISLDEQTKDNNMVYYYFENNFVLKRGEMSFNEIIDKTNATTQINTSFEKYFKENLNIDIKYGYIREYKQEYFKKANVGDQITFTINNMEFYESKVTNVVFDSKENEYTYFVLLNNENFIVFESEIVNVISKNDLLKEELKEFVSNAKNQNKEIILEYFDF